MGKKNVFGREWVTITAAEYNADKGDSATVTYVLSMEMDPDGYRQLLSVLARGVAETQPTTRDGDYGADVLRLLTNAVTRKVEYSRCLALVSEIENRNAGLVLNNPATGEPG